MDRSVVHTTIVKIILELSSKGTLRPIIRIRYLSHSERVVILKDVRIAFDSLVKALVCYL